MSAYKWFGGIAGWMAGGPLGALLGYWIGSLLEKGSKNEVEEVAHAGGNAPRDSFLFSLLVLTAAIIKADGKIMHSEMEHVRGFFRRQFGDEAAREANDILLSLFNHPIDVDGCCRQMATHMDYAQRLQLLDYLVGIARADGRVDESEVRMLRRIATALQLGLQEVDSLLGLGGTSTDDAYKVLEVAPSATDAEVRRAYKQLVLKHHPDRMATLGDDVKQAAEEKLKQINEAYDRIRQERGMK